MLLSCIDFLACLLGRRLNVMYLDIVDRLRGFGSLGLKLHLLLHLVEGLAQELLRKKGPNVPYLDYLALLVQLLL